MIKYVENFKDYEVFDCGNGEKIERFDKFILRRPDPQAIWHPENFNKYKVNAIYQIFEFRLLNSFPKEMNQTNETIMHAIERIWLYLVKLNGYNYKMIFRYY